MGVFGAVTSAVNHAWGVEQPLGFWRHKLIAFVMLLASGLLLMAALLLTGAIQVVESNWFSGVVDQFPWLAQLRGFVYRNSLTPTFIFVVGLIYYYAPNAQVRLRDVWFGAILAGVLWRFAFAGFAWYIAATSERLTVHGYIGTVIVFLLWVYISAIIFLYGVEVTAAYARLRKHLPQQAPAAPARDG
jgi:membrane protein